MSNNIMKGWKLDAGKEKHRVIFRDYQKAIVDILINQPKTQFGSGEIYKILKAKGIKISRASVIFYLTFLSNDKLVTYVEVTGKGGWHKLYQINKTWDEVKAHIAIRVVEALGEGLDLDVDWIARVRTTVKNGIMRGQRLKKND